MTIEFTTNLTTVNAGYVDDSEKVDTISLQTYAGQTDQTTVRIINNQAGIADVLVYTTDPNLSLSLNDSRGFVPAIDMSIGAGAVSPTIWVKLTADLDAGEGARQSTIFCGEKKLIVNYYIAQANTGDIPTKSQADRYLGTETLNILEQFENEGEVVVIDEYIPQMKPGKPMTGVCYSNKDFVGFNSPAEWCNPKNERAGYKKVNTYQVKAFVGDQNLTMSNLIDYLQGDLTFTDESRLLLPPDFEGFRQTTNPIRVRFSDYSSQTKLYQHTVYVLHRHNAEYALLNIREQSYFRGQFLYYVADLSRIQYPGADSMQGFLPWNMLFDSSGKFVQYVKSWSTTSIEDPYGEITGSSST